MFEFYQDKAGEWRWRVIGGNGEIIAAASEGYNELRDCRNNVHLLMKAIFDQTLDIMSKTDW